nr:hypothetical protein [Tanacetum cinerariifolium]
DGESMESYYSRFYKMMNELIRNQCKVTNHQVNVQFLLQLQPEWQRNKEKVIVNFPQPIYDQEPSMVAEDDETSKDKEIDKLMDLISLSIGNVARARETVGSTVKPKRVKDAAYHREKMLLCKQEEVGIQLNAEQADWRDDTDDEELEDQELEAHYMYMAQLQEVSPDAADYGPIFDDEPLQKLTTGRLINGLSCGGIDMVIKDLDLEPKIDAMRRDIFELYLMRRSLEVLRKFHMMILGGRFN